MGLGAASAFNGGLFRGSCVLGRRSAWQSKYAEGQSFLAIFAVAAPSEHDAPTRQRGTPHLCGTPGPRMLVRFREVRVGTGSA
jgi:hypothetical protein